MKKLASHSTLFALLLTPMISFGGGNQPFFYRTGYYIYAPRFERDFLSTWQVSVQGGTAKKGYQSNSAIGASGSSIQAATPTGTHTQGDNSTTDVLNIYGWQNFQFLGANIVGNPGTNIYNTNLAILDQQTTNGTYGYVQYSGKFNYVEADIYIAQNFKKGFFATFNLPIIHTGMKDVEFADMSPSTGFPNNLNADWQFLLNNLPATLANYNLAAGDTSKSGIGDIEIYLGWTMNKEDICNSVDFLDTTIRVGVNIPSGFKKDENQAFSIAAGYDGHVGIPISFDAAIGFLEWVTFGAHVGGTFFTSKTKVLRLQTSTAQNGFIKLGYDTTKRDLGNLFDAGAYLKADHVFKGLSLQVGYIYARESKSTLTATDTVTYPTAVINSDSMLLGWHYHSINAEVNYDFAREGRRFNPIIGVFYSQPVAGTRVFLTRTGGGYAGVNVAWDF